MIIIAFIHISNKEEWSYLDEFDLKLYNYYNMTRDLVGLEKSLFVYCFLFFFVFELLNNSSLHNISSTTAT